MNVNPGSGGGSPTWSSILSESAQRDVSSWNVPCRSVFEFLSNEYPHDLLVLSRSLNDEPAKLTFALEWLGRAAAKSGDRKFMIDTVDAFEQFVKHDSVIVREGALYGIEYMIEAGVAGARELAENVSKHDTSTTIRMIADGVLAWDE